MLGAALALLSLQTPAQSPSNIQYTYDAAGNVIGVTRVSAALPDLTVSNLSVGLISAVGNGSYTIQVTFQVNNIGNATAVATWYDRGYLSANTILHDTDQVLAGYNTHSTNLAAGASYTVNTTFTTRTTTAPGNWYLIVKADGGAASSGQFSPTGPNYVAESNEYNNTQAIAINLQAHPLPDLTVSNAGIGAITVSQAGAYSIPVTFTVNNIGQGSAGPTWHDLAYLSTNAVLDNNSVNLTGNNYRSTPLASGASYTVTTTFTTTTTTPAGSYTLFVKADGHGATLNTGTNTDNGSVAESNEANNAQALSITLPTLPDLTVTGASIGAITVSQAGAYSFPVTFTVKNIGGSAAQAVWHDLAYLSMNGVLDNTSVNLTGNNYRATSLAAGTSYTVTPTFSTTTTIAAGNYTLFVKADGHGTTLNTGTNTDNGNLVESNETNNTQALSLTLPTLPDLTMTSLSVGTIVKNADHSYSIPATFTVKNSGGSAAQQVWHDLAYLSTNGVLDSNSVNLSGNNYRATALAAGATYTVTVTFKTTTTTAAGTYTLFVKADGHGSSLNTGTNTDNGNVVESNETNNTASATVMLP